MAKDEKEGRKRERKRERERDVVNQRLLLLLSIVDGVAFDLPVMSDGSNRIGYDFHLLLTCSHTVIFLQLSLFHVIRFLFSYLNMHFVCVCI